MKIYKQAIKTYLNVDVLVSLDNVLYTTDDFFEPDYHLGDIMGEKYTNIFVNALKKRR